MKLYHVNETYLDELRKIEPKIPQIKGSNGTKPRPFVGIILTINSVNYIAPLSSQIHNKRTDFKIFAAKGQNQVAQVATVRTAYMFPIPLEELQEIDFTQEQIKDKSYAALLINEINYIKKEKNSNKLIELANKTYEYTVTKRYHFEKFCCDFLALESHLKSRGA